MILGSRWFGGKVRGGLVARFAVVWWQNGSLVLQYCYVKEQLELQLHILMPRQS